MLIELPAVITPSLTINSIILFFVKLVGLFNIPNSLKKSHNASFDILSKKIASCSFGILLCFINEIAKYEDDIIIYVLDMYNMNKYFIGYHEKQLYVCFDGKHSYLNLIIKHKDNAYLYADVVHENNKMNNAFKRMFKLKDKSSSLYFVFCMIINQFNSDPKKDKS